jgi:phosphoribosyl-dephospho-CoA transferase
VTSSRESTLRRHDLVWLDETRWRDALLTPMPNEWLEPLSCWFSHGRPAVVRRGDSSAPHALSLGVALPPAQGKLKLPLLVDRSAVMRSSGPLTLAAAAVTTPPIHWRTWLEDLLVSAHGIGIELRVYGSVAWQHLSGEPYLTPFSDVDLLWSAGDQTHLEEMLEILIQWERHSGLSADGELLFFDGAVAWKELLRRPSKVLVKRNNSVEMRQIGDVLSSLKAEAC